MKYLLVILLLMGSAFAQNTKYFDGTMCICDSIVNIYDEKNISISSYPYINGYTNGLVKTYWLVDTDIPSVYKRLKHSTLDVIKEQLQYKVDSVYTEASANIRYMENTNNQYTKQAISWIEHDRDSVINMINNFYDTLYKNEIINQFINLCELQSNLCGSTKSNAISRYSIIPYTKGSANGMEIGYSSKHVVLYEIPWVNGKRHGNAKWYNTTGNFGQISGTATFKDGVLIGHKKCSDGRFGNEFMECNDQIR